MVQVSLFQRKNWQEGSSIGILTGGSQKIKTTNIDPETAVLKYIKELVKEPALIHQFFAIFAKTNCSLFENFQKPEINMVFIKIKEYITNNQCGGAYPLWQVLYPLFPDLFSKNRTQIRSDFQNQN